MSSPSSSGGPVAKSKAKVVWSRLADLDLDSAHSYLRERGHEAARRLAANILDGIDQLRRHPQSGPVANDLFPEGRYRHLPVGRYRIIYRIADGAILVLRVWDTRRDPERLSPE